MGNVLGYPSVYYLYSRNKESDCYNEDPHFEILRTKTVRDEQALGFFKREVYAFALDHLYPDDKSIYLYMDSARMARAHRPDRYSIDITFWREDLKDLWFRSPELLPPGRWPLLGSRFWTRWRAIQTADRAGDLTIALRRV